MSLVSAFLLFFFSSHSSQQLQGSGGSADGGSCLHVRVSLCESGTVCIYHKPPPGKMFSSIHVRKYSAWDRECRRVGGALRSRFQTLAAFHSFTKTFCGPVDSVGLALCSFTPTHCRDHRAKPCTPGKMELSRAVREMRGAPSRRQVAS